jgi:hypothetical protein
VYRFQVLRNQVYGFVVTGNAAAGSVVLSLTDEAGGGTEMNVLNNGKTLFGHLAPGTYLLTATGWDPGQAAELSYRIHLSIVATSENAPPVAHRPGARAGAAAREHRPVEPRCDLPRVHGQPAPGDARVGRKRRRE